MKKFLTLIVALTLMLTSAAFAENVPTPQFGSQAETEPTEPIATEKVEYTIPSGQRAFPYAMVEAGQNSGFMIRDWEFTDAVQAEEPAEHSLKYTSLPGTKLLHIRFVARYCADRGWSSNKEDVGVEGWFQGTVTDGTQKAYMTTVFIEGSENTISTAACLHETADCTTHSNNYMMQLNGSKKYFQINDHDYFALCDFIAEIPEELVGTDMPLYLVLTFPKIEAEYYIQLQ